MQLLAAVDAVAFDLDCTLVDVFASKRAGASAAGRAAALAGDPRSPGDVAAAIYEALLASGLDDDEAVERRVAPCAAAAARRAFARAEARAATAYAGARATLLALRARGYALALVTDAPARFAARRLRANALSGLFDEIVTREDTPLGKADARPFALAAARLGVSPSRMVAVGDHPERDVGSARALGCATALALWGAHVPGVATPDLRLARPQDLLDALPGPSRVANTGQAPRQQEAVA